MPIIDSLVKELHNIINSLPNIITLSFNINLPDRQEQMLKKYVASLNKARNRGGFTPQTHIQAAVKTVGSKHDRVIFRLAKHPHLRIVYGTFDNKQGLYADINYRNWPYRHIYWRLLSVTHDFLGDYKSRQAKLINTHESILKREVFVEAERLEACELIYTWMIDAYNIPQTDLDQLLITFQSDRKWWQALW